MYIFYFSFIIFLHMLEECKRQGVKKMAVRIFFLKSFPMKDALFSNVVSFIEVPSKIILYILKNDILN
jgi:hypothetical protein